MKKRARWEPPDVPGFFDGGRDKIDRNAVRHTSNIVMLWPDVELQAVGLMKFTCATEPATATALEELNATLLGQSWAGRVAGRPT